MKPPTHRVITTQATTTSSGTQCVTYVCALTCKPLPMHKRLAWALRRMMRR